MWQSTFSVLLIVNCTPFFLHCQPVSVLTKTKNSVFSYLVLTGPFRIQSLKVLMVEISSVVWEVTEIPSCHRHEPVGSHEGLRHSSLTTNPIV